MKQNSKNNLEVETIGVPIIDALSTEDKKAFAKALLLCAIEYYKGQNEKDDKISLSLPFYSVVRRIKFAVYFDFAVFNRRLTGCAGAKKYFVCAEGIVFFDIAVCKRFAVSYGYNLKAFLNHKRRELPEFLEHTVSVHYDGHVFFGVIRGYSEIVLHS